MLCRDEFTIENYNFWLHGGDNGKYESQINALLEYQSVLTSATISEGGL